MSPSLTEKISGIELTFMVNRNKLNHSEIAELQVIKVTDLEHFTKLANHTNIR